MWGWLQEGLTNKKKNEEARLEITYSPLSSGKRRWWRCLPLTALGPVGRGSICGWPWSSRLVLACNRALVGMSTSRRRRRALKDYITHGRKAALIGNNVGTSLERVITSLGRLRLSGLSH